MKTELRRWRFAWVWLLAIPLSSLHAEVSVKVLNPPGDYYKVGIFPFDAGNDKDRVRFSQAFNQELAKLGKYDLASPRELQIRLRAGAQQLAELDDRSVLLRAGQLKLDAAITGSIDAIDDRTLITVRLLDGKQNSPVLTALYMFPTQGEAGEPSAVAGKMLQDILPKIVKKVEVIDMTGGLAELRIARRAFRSMELTWNPSQEKNLQYRIQRATNKTGPFEDVATVNPAKEKSHLDRGAVGSALQDDKLYFYRVQVIRNGKPGEPSAPIWGVTQPKPAAPAVLTYETMKGPVIDLSWSPSTSPDVVGYRVERAPEDDPLGFVILHESNALTYRDEVSVLNPLRYQTLYLYRVSAKHRSGVYGKPSEVLEAETAEKTFLQTDVTAEGGHIRSVPLFWKTSVNTNVIGYKVLRKSGDSVGFDLVKVLNGRTNTRYEDGGETPSNLEDQTRYTYQIQTVLTAQQTGRTLGTATARTRARPPTVSHLKATSGQPRQVHLTWDVSTDMKIGRYEIWRAINLTEDYKFIGLANRRESNSFTDRGGGDKVGELMDGTAYKYKVIAINHGEVRSPWSRAETATTKLAPRRPIELSATTGKPRFVTVAWKRNPETDIRTYVVNSSSSQNFSTFAKSVNVSASGADAHASYQHDGMSDGEYRYFRVKAIDADGLESAWSEVIQGQAKPAPSMPLNLAKTFKEGGFELRWDCPPQGDIVEYKIWIKKGLLGWKEAESTKDPVYSLGKKNAGKKINVAVSAVDADKLESARTEPVLLDRGEEEVKFNEFTKAKRGFF